MSVVASARRTARGVLRVRIAAIVHTAMTGPSTSAATIHAWVDAKSRPSFGAPTTRKTASPTLIATAPTQSRPSRRRPSQAAPRGRAKRRPVHSRGWTTISEPTPKASAWSPNPTQSATVPRSHRGRRNSRQSRPGRIDRDSGTARAARCWRTEARA